jgi:hypothetical protein
VSKSEIAIEFTLPTEERVPRSAEDSVLGTVTSGTPDVTVARTFARKFLIRL